MSKARARSPRLAFTTFWSLDEFEAAAQSRMRPAVRDFVQLGAGAGAAVRRNREAWQRWRIRSRALVDVSRIDLATDLLGERLSAPILFAPTGMHAFVHREAESETARAARAAGSIMVLSMGSSRRIERIAKEGARHWLQLYWGQDREHVRRVLREAEQAGFGAVCLTTDVPGRPWLHAPMRAALAVVGRARPAYLAPRAAHIDPASTWDHDARLTWADLEWLRAATTLPIVLKGIMTAADARLAIEHGASAIIVSNHGGRALAEAPATADVLSEIVAAVGARLPVLVDGGIRSGGDVFKALALGASAVLIGRPVLWGLAVGGAAGAARVFELLASELRTICASAGAPDRTSITGASLQRE